MTHPEALPLSEQFRELRKVVKEAFAENDKRVAELLVSNNEYLERACAAERQVKELQRRLTHVEPILNSAQKSESATAGLKNVITKLKRVRDLSRESHGLEEYRSHQSPHKVDILTTRGGGSVLNMQDILDLAAALA